MGEEKKHLLLINPRRGEPIQGVLKPIGVPVKVLKSTSERPEKRERLMSPSLRGGQEREEKAC
eukprot:3685377-Prorocentrum_lima.AAC.1